MSWIDLANTVKAYMQSYVTGLDGGNVVIGDELAVVSAMATGGYSVGCVVAYDTADSVGSRFVDRRMIYSVMANVFSEVDGSDLVGAYSRAVSMVQEALDNISSSGMFKNYVVRRVGAGPVIQYVRSDRYYYVVPIDFQVETG